jgi:hypothetical protein
MADYYPLLSKAVAGLADGTPEARLAVYERARAALFGQLRNLDPPIPEEVIERESQALEVAIAQIETEIASRSSIEGAATLSQADIDLLARAGRAEAGFLVGGEAGAATSLRPQPRDIDSGRASPSPGPGPATRAKHPPQPLKVRRDLKGRGAAKAQVGGTGSSSDKSASGYEVDTFSLEASPADSPGFEPLAFDEPNPSPAGSEPSATTWLEAHHPFAPQPKRERDDVKRLMIVAGIVGLVVLLVAIAAYKLRDHPEDLVRLQPPTANQGEAGGGAKIADRVGAGAATPDSSAASGGTPSSTADRGTDATRNGPGPANPAIAVARRAALLVEAPGEQTKVKTFLGTVTWRVENVASGQDEPLRTAVEAEIDVPEEKVQATVTIQKNFDGTLPASHTVKLIFVVPPDSPLGNIKQISALQMRQEDTPTGEALKGITVPIMENSFLIGLAKGDAEASNLDLLRSREWLDVPILLANGHIAKLTFEKGPSGQRALDDAMAAWQGQ